MLIISKPLNISQFEKHYSVINASCFLPSIRNYAARHDELNWNVHTATTRIPLWNTNLYPDTHRPHKTTFTSKIYSLWFYVPKCVYVAPYAGSKHIYTMSWNKLHDASTRIMLTLHNLGSSSSSHQFIFSKVYHDVPSLRNSYEP